MEMIVNRQNEKNMKNTETRLLPIRNSHFGFKDYLKDTKTSDLLMLKPNVIDLEKTDFTAGDIEN